MTWTPRLVLLVAATALVACGGSRPAGDSAARPADASVQSQAPPAAPSVAEPAACAPCHADEVARWSRSAHALAARPLSAREQPPRADLGSAENAATGATGGRAFALRGADGQATPREVVAVLGGRRREDYLVSAGGELHVAPESWSVVRGAWVHPTQEAADDAGSGETPLPWHHRRRAHERQCSRCHPVADSGEAAFACSTCHANAAAHAAQASSGLATQAGSPSAGVARDALNGCGPCHATGSVFPRVTGVAPVGTLALDDLLLPATAGTPVGLDRAFLADGRPATAHGLEALALRQSACFLKGGATCLTCHDPHGGADARTSLRDTDPDAACRTCHAAQATDTATHARHRVLTGTVPLAHDEPKGPSAERLPGCVDCHAPAVIPFGRDGHARDHAFGVPFADPSVDERAAGGVADACSACHASRGRLLLARDREQRGTSAVPQPRALWARALRAGAQQSADAPELLAQVLADASVPPDVRASAAQLVPPGLAPDSPTAVALVGVLAESADVGLLRAALSALGRGAGMDLAAVRKLQAAPVAADWRVRLAVLSALDQGGDTDALSGLEALRSDATLPDVARGEAAFELGMGLLRREALTRAELLLAESTRAFPERAAAWLNLGVARARLGDADGARLAWHAVLDLAPNDPFARANLAALAAAQQ